MLILFSRLRTVVFLALLGVVGIVAYWQALNGYFLSDDFVSVLHMQRMDEDFNVLLRDFWSNWGGVPTTLFFRPLVSVTLYLDHCLWGWDAGGYHLTNIIMHVGSGMLLFLIARRLGGGGRGAWSCFCFFGCSVVSHLAA